MVWSRPLAYFQPRDEKLTSRFLFRLVAAAGAAEVVICSSLSGAWRCIIPDRVEERSQAVEGVARDK